MGLQMLDIAPDIYSGGLNKYIIYPLNYFEFKWIQQMTHTMSRILQLLITLSVYMLIIKMPDGFHMSITHLLLFLINIFISSTLFFVMESLMEVTAFWAENVWSLSVLLRFLIGFFSGAWLSLSLFPNWSQVILDILPFKGMVYTPVRLLMGEVSLGEWMQVQIISMTWILIFGIILSLVWKKGRLLYSGVGI
jgi:ABC-2 type transport system permease protein